MIICWLVCVCVWGEGGRGEGGGAGQTFHLVSVLLW